MILNTSTLDPSTNYQLLSGGITPRPIAWISTCSSDGIDNLAPFSFFTVASCNPPVLLYTQVAQRNGQDKDTLSNLLDTKECVVNVVSPALAERMNMSSASIASNESEFNFADIRSCVSNDVKPLSVKEAPIRYECKLRDVQRISELPAGGTIVLLDVVTVYLRDELYSNGRVNHALLDTVGRLGGDFYTNTSEKYELTRPG